MHSPTSIAAAASIVRHLNRLEAVVYQTFVAHPNGLTDEEGIAASGLGPSTYRPRRVRLVTLGLVEDTGRTRLGVSGRKAAVWALVVTSTLL